MANPNDLRESFPSLEDSSTGAGVPLTKSLEGDAAAGKVGATEFVFKDSNGNLVLPQLDSQGRLPVSTDNQGTKLRANGAASGVLLGNGATYNETVVLSIPLTAAKNYQDMKGTISCRRGAFFEMAYQDSVNTVVLAQAILDSGQFSGMIGVDGGDFFNVPASASTPQFIVRGGNFDKVSDLHAMLVALQTN